MAKRGLEMTMDGKQPKRVGPAPRPSGKSHVLTHGVSEWVGNVAEPIELHNLFGGSAVEMAPGHESVTISVHPMFRTAYGPLWTIGC